MRGGMADDIEKKEALRAIRDALVEQMVRLGALDEPWLVNDVSLAIDRINSRLGEAPSEADIERVRRNLFLS